MRVTMLGTGSAMPSSSRLQSGILLESTDGTVLVDCGSGVVHRIAQSDRSHRDVDTVLLTHHHLDHVADLPTLCKARLLDDHADLTVIGPPGTRSVCERLLTHDGLNDRVNLSVREIRSGSAVDVGGYRVRSVDTHHADPSLAYRFDDRLTVSGDTAPSDAVFALADGSHTLVHECSFPDDVRTEDHTTPNGLLTGLSDVTIERLVATHLFPRMEAESERLGARLATDVAAESHVGVDRLQLAIPD